MWQPSESSQTEGEDSQARRPPGLARGRPPGLHGSHLYRRVLRQRRARPVGQPERDQEQEQDEQRLVKHRRFQHDDTRILQHMRPVGSAIVRQVVTALTQEHTRVAEVPDRRMVAHFLDDMHRSISGIAVESQLLNVSRTHLPDEIKYLAALVHWCSRAWLGSLASHLRMHFLSRSMEPVACFFFGHMTAQA